MTREQKEAIDRLNYINRAYDYNNYYSNYDLDCIDVLLNLVEEQEKEIEHWKNGFERELESNRENACELLKQDLIIRKKDKMIDLMAKQLAGLTIFDIDKEKPLILGDKEEVKQYFKTKEGEVNC